MDSSVASEALERGAASVRGSLLRRSGVSEFLWTGGATLVLFPLAWLLERTLGLETAELAVGVTAFHAAHVINDPHFSVTYLLFYRKLRGVPEFSTLQRVRYWTAGFVVPIGLVAWVAGGIASGSARTLGLLFELMFVLVGWHYVKQGFGVFLVLSARRGVRYAPQERRVVLGHCLTGWAYAWTNPASAARLVEEKGVVYGALAHPRWLELVAAVAFALSAVFLGGMLVRKARREGRFPPFLPLVGLVVSVWLWTLFSSLNPLMIYLIPALHSIQYLYFVRLLEENQAREFEGPPCFGRPARERVALLAVSAIGLGWLLFHAVPEVLDWARFLVPRSVHRMSDLGTTPWFAGAFAIVNIHHYFMDTVIWRRENPETTYLYR